MIELTATDYAILDVLDEGPDNPSNIALETGFMPETVRRSLRKLKVAGYIIERHLERTGFCKSQSIYEHARTRKAA